MPNDSIIAIVPEQTSQEDEFKELIEGLIDGKENLTPEEQEQVVTACSQRTSVILDKIIRPDAYKQDTGEPLNLAQQPIRWGFNNPALYCTVMGRMMEDYKRSAEASSSKPDLIETYDIRNEVAFNELVRNVFIAYIEVYNKHPQGEDEFEEAYLTATSKLGEMMTIQGGLESYIKDYYNKNKVPADKWKEKHGKYYPDDWKERESKNHERALDPYKKKTASTQVQTIVPTSGNGTGSSGGDRDAAHEQQGGERDGEPAAEASETEEMTKEEWERTRAIGRQVLSIASEDTENPELYSSQIGLGIRNITDNHIEDTLQKAGLYTQRSLIFGAFLEMYNRYADTPDRQVIYLDNPKLTQESGKETSYVVVLERRPTDLSMDNGRVTLGATDLWRNPKSDIVMTIVEVPGKNSDFIDSYTKELPSRFMNGSPDEEKRDALYMHYMHHFIAKRKSKGRK